jgi:molybdopterin synthase sulfur carrier subunit
MSVKVKFFASLREQIGKSEIEINTPENILQAWSQATNDLLLPKNILMSVNMEYVDTDVIIKDGDEIAFFPPVTGG